MGGSSCPGGTRPKTSRWSSYEAKEQEAPGVTGQSWITKILFEVGSAK